MPQYVYGIVEAARDAPAETGIDGRKLRLIRGGRCAALVSDLEGSELRLGRSEAMTHTRVLEAALAGGTVLPMRFGVVMEDVDAIQSRLLGEHERDLMEQLDRLAGKVEITIRGVYEETTLMREVVRDDPEVARMRSALQGKPEAATYYDRIRLGELVAHAVESKRQADASMILEALGPCAENVSVGAPAHERVVISASFLVDTGRLKAFDRRLDELAAAQADRMRFKYTGPLPPHSFVELAGNH